MKINRIVKTEALLSILGSLGLLIWWFLMPTLLPISDSAENFKNLILDDNWIAVNMIGLISTLLLTLGFPGFYLKNHKKFNGLGFPGLIISSVGLILFTCIQYYETLLWPAAAKVNPELIQVGGALVSGNTGVVAGLLVSGVFLGIGYILFGISALQTKLYPKTPIWFLIIGAPVFGNGIVFPVRTVGLILFCIGTIWVSRHIIKDEK
jgi:hypothetical protein